MKKFFIGVAIVAASTLSVIKANDININNNMNSLKIDDVEALAEEEKIGPWGTNWAEYYYYCGYNIGTYCGRGLGLCIWGDPCDD